MSHSHQKLRIGEFVIEPITGLVWRADDDDAEAAHHLQPKVMSVLVCLVEHQDDVVERDDLIAAVWGRPVTDDVLTRAIYELRAVFDDHSGDPRYIQTIPKIGYKLIATVETLDTPSSKESSTADNRATDQQTVPVSIPTSKWRHLAVAGVVIVLITVSMLIVTRREPQIEFGENDRVVLASFENITDDPQLGRALDIAFRTGIEQSQKITIMPPVAVVSALERMQKDKDTRIDRETAIEICLRERARAAIVATVANVGDSYRLSGEILEPQSGRTVFIHQSSNLDRNQILQGLDEIIAAIRQESGEALSVIEENTIPLEKVTTANFEALEAYSIGMRTAGMADLEVALPFFKEAIRLDPTFAMAYANLGLLQLVLSDEDPEADLNLEKALENRDRLTRKEQLFVEALRVRNERPSVVKDAWTVLTVAFPNYAEGHRNLGNIYIRYDNDFEKSEAELRQAVEIADLWNPVGYHNLGFALLGMGQYNEALENFRIAWGASGQPMAAGLGIALIATGNYAEADTFLRTYQSLQAGSVRQTIEAATAMYFLDQGQFSQALQMTRKAAATAAGDFGGEQRSLVARCAILELYGERQAFAECLSEAITKELALYDSRYFKQRYWPAANLAFLGKIAARNAMHAEAMRALQPIQSRHTGDEYYWIEAYAGVLEAEMLMIDGTPKDAIRILQPLVQDRALFQAHESLARAYDRAGETDQAINEYQWLAGARGQAFSEQLSRRYGNEFHVLDWAMAHLHLGRLYENRGTLDNALVAYETLLDHWVNADADVPAVALAQHRVSEIRASATNR